jgi:hypothetical protein
MKNIDISTGKFHLSFQWREAETPYPLLYAGVRVLLKPKTAGRIMEQKPINHRVAERDTEKGQDEEMLKKIINPIFLNAAGRSIAAESG